MANTALMGPNEDPEETKKREQPGRTRKPDGASTIYFGNDGRWHGRVTVGVLDSGRPDRRHVSSKSESVVIDKVRKLEQRRDKGTVPDKHAKAWTVATWLAHWVENITTTYASDNTIAGYRVAVYHHLTPGLGGHKLTALKPEHLETFYAKMRSAGSAPATAHQAHRTIRAALNEAIRRGHLERNPATIAKAPKLSGGDDDEVEPYSVDEVQRLMLSAAERRNSARWVIALALGLRQGEVLGLRWEHVDLDAGYMRVRRSRLRPKYKHGCSEPCGRKYPGYCPQRVPIRKDTKDTKSRAGRRTIALPDPLIKILRAHREAQAAERAAAGQLWVEDGWVFTNERGQVLNPRTDFTRWKDLLAAAQVPDRRLHDARHTAATVLLLLGVDKRVVMQIMGWSSEAMLLRYQHVTDPMLKQAAKRVGRLLWESPGKKSPSKKKGKKKRRPKGPTAPNETSE